MNDVSNLQASSQSSANAKNKVRIKPKQKQTKKKEKNAVSTESDSLPNFDSFDDYSLVVQPVTPLKTHVSQSSSSGWTNVPTLNSYELKVMIEAIQADSLATSSPKVGKVRRQFTPPSAINDQQTSASKPNISGMVTRSMSKSIASSTQSSIGMHTRRAKRIRQITHDDSMSTSTPQQHRKISRLVQLYIISAFAEVLSL